MTTIEYMYDMLIEARTNLESLGYNVGDLIDFDISNRYRRAWAKCYKKGYRQFTIILSGQLFKAISSSVRDTIYHEVIHTCEGCFNHGPNFKYAANECNMKFGTNIRVSATIDEMMNGKN